jgi:integrase
MLLMGHASLSMTDRYTGAEMDRQVAALELIAERLMGEAQGGVQ